MRKRKTKKQKEILKELLEDSTQSYADIAKKLGMHHNTVKRYISEYEEKGIILGYSCDIACEKVASTYIVLLRCVPISEEDSTLLKKRIKEGKLNTEKLKVLDSFFTVGEFQNILLIMCTDVLELHRYLNLLSKRYDRFIKSYVLLQISRTNQRNLHSNLDWESLRKLVPSEDDFSQV